MNVMTREAYYSSEYLDKVYYFCLKKTKDAEDAKDLAQEISVEILSALAANRPIAHFSAYVWRVARNRYARWAEGKMRRRQYESEDLSELDEVIPGGENVEESVLKADDLNRLRRELALTMREYREILVAYYIENQSIAAIAQKLSIPAGTVKTKLYQGRIRLKGGMEMAREFGQKSYAPEDILIAKSGASTWDFVPDKFLEDCYPDSKICKNVLIQAYDNPSTPEELSIELGIALPYLEPYIEAMADATLMLRKKTGARATYETNFVIISGDARRRMVDKLAKIQKSFVKNAADYLTRARKLQLADKVSILGDYQDYEEQKWTLALRLADDIQWSLYHKRGLDFNYDTKRPDGGSWDVMGSQKFEGREFYWIGHSFHETHGFPLTMFVTEKEAESEYDKTVLLMDYRMELLQRLLASGGGNLTDEEAKLLGPAVRKRSDGAYGIAFGVYRREHESGGLRCGIPIETYNAELLPLWEKLLEPAEEYIADCEAIMRGEIPQKLKSQFNFCMHSIPFLRGMLVEGLLENNFLKPEEELSDMIGVYTTI